MPISRLIFDRFIEKVEPLESGCWLWKGGTIKGYGEIGGRTAPLDSSTGNPPGGNFTWHWPERG